MVSLFRNVVDLPRKLKPDRMFIVTDDIPKKFLYPDDNTDGPADIIG
jgi:hypothetical protein